MGILDSFRKRDLIKYFYYRKWVHSQIDRSLDSVVYKWLKKVLITLLGWQDDCEDVSLL